LTNLFCDVIFLDAYSFAMAVLASIGQGSARILAGALMALLELDQSAFNEGNVIDMVALISAWTGIVIPARRDYMAGGRLARQSYYEALYTVSGSILTEANEYLSLRNHLQRVADVRPANAPPERSVLFDMSICEGELRVVADRAERLIREADGLCSDWNERRGVKREECIAAYEEANKACRELLKVDNLAFQIPFFKSYYRRNYDALVILTVVNNVLEDVDEVRAWLVATLRGLRAEMQNYASAAVGTPIGSPSGSVLASASSPTKQAQGRHRPELSTIDERIFTSPQAASANHHRELVSAVIELVFHDEGERQTLRRDGINYLLMGEGEEKRYDFTIIAAMGVITEGKRGTEMEDSFERLKVKRGIDTIRADTGTARSFEFNGSKVSHDVTLG